MALPKSLAPSLSPQELAFLAENEPIEIVPLFSMTPVRLLSGVYGPFQPPAKSQVPLWLATSLKRKRKCRIVPPEWFNVDTLNGLVQEEKDKSDSFVRLPRYFVEISKILLDVAPDDLTLPSQLHSILLSLRHLRLAKIRHGLRPSPQARQSGVISSRADTGAFSGRGEYLRLTGLTRVEVVEMKGLLVGVMGVMTRLGEGGAEEGDGDGEADGDGEQMGG